jgi:hypothetical protein
MNDEQVRKKLATFDDDLALEELFLEDGLYFYELVLAQDSLL